MMANKTVVWVLHKEFSQSRAYWGLSVSLLVTKQRRSHTANNDVNCNAKRDKEARGYGTHTSQSRHSRRATKN